VRLDIANLHTRGIAIPEGYNGNQFYMGQDIEAWHTWYYSTSHATARPRLYLKDVDSSDLIDLHVGTVVSNGTTLSFTGVHIAYYVGTEPLTEADIGKVLMLDGTLAKPTTMHQSHPNGRICDVDCCTSVYGVISSINPVDDAGENHGEVQVNSLGEGGALVHDSATQSVSITVGDLLVSTADGYVRKLQANEPESSRYVIARSLETYSGPSPYLLAVTYHCA
jgi:hypothetical protein